MSDKIKNFRRGFALIELMVVVGIISLMTAIFLPQYKEFKSKAYNATAEHSLRSLVNAQEAVYADTLAYVACLGSENCENLLIGFKKAENVEIEAVLVGDGYSLHACSKKGPKHYVFDSADSPGKFAQSFGISTNIVGSANNAPPDTSLNEDCSL